jgi:hypothetical protein
MLKNLYYVETFYSEWLDFDQVYAPDPTKSGYTTLQTKYCTEITAFLFSFTPLHYKNLIEKEKCKRILRNEYFE